MRICILALTKIYILTHQYQSLVREITTPTLPTFLSTCIRLVTPQSSGEKHVDPSLSLVETIFNAFSALLPRHPAIFRPSTKQIHLILRKYLAPTSSDARYVPSSLVGSARQLKVLLYQTAAKNTGGEEWTKGIRDLVKEAHQTTDVVYRSVIEDWESAAGYFSQPVDVNEELHGGDESETHYPFWTGMSSGLQRLVGFLGLIEEHFKLPTPTAVAIPLGSLVDLLTRILSVVEAKTTKGTSNYGSVRLNPSIERSEREELFCGLPAVHVAAMRVYDVLSDRLERNFTSLAHGTLDQVIWVFPAGRHEELFRAAVYSLVSKLMPLVGSSLPRTAVAGLIPILRSCVTDLQPNTELEVEMDGKSTKTTNFDHFLVKDGFQSTSRENKRVEVQGPASALLPALLSHLPHHNLREQHRAELDRTAILTGHRDAMVASILNPFTRRNGSTFYSILPHLSRNFPGDEVVELSLRPRAPMVGRASTGRQDEPVEDEPVYGELHDEDAMEGIVADMMSDSKEEPHPNPAGSQLENTEMSDEPAPKRINLWDQHSTKQKVFKEAAAENSFEATNSLKVKGHEASFLAPVPTHRAVIPVAPMSRTELGDPTPKSTVDEDEDDSGESVHLNMELSESEDDEDEDEDEDGDEDIAE